MITAAELVKRDERANRVNAFLVAISWGRRRFFACGIVVARFDVGQDGRPFFMDAYTRQQVDVQRRASRSWMRFTHGGTLRRLIEALADFIITGKPMPRHHLGPWSETCCNGDPWAYGKEYMQKLREEAERLGIIEKEAS